MKNQLDIFDMASNPIKSDIVEKAISVLSELNTLGLEEKVEALNEIRVSLHSMSPFASEPVDLVEWVKADRVHANDYNPNSVAPPEMELLRLSIMADGYTQPIVTNPEDDSLIVVDGFHRNRVGKECKDVKVRTHGYLPVVRIRDEQADRSNRMASTIRHNRARGKHRVEAMSEIVIELKRRNWSDEKICKELGMDRDEVLRLCQISGLSELFADQAFSNSWEPEGHISPDDFQDISGNVADYVSENIEVRVPNTEDESRIFHTYEDWECFKAGFYETKPPHGMTGEQARSHYKNLLQDIPEFERILECVITEWKNSCEHYLTNTAMNRIAWLGQAALCYKWGIPAEFRSGYGLLTEDMQKAADTSAFNALNRWMERNGREAVTWEQALPDRQSDIY